MRAALQADGVAGSPLTWRCVEAGLHEAVAFRPHPELRGGRKTGVYRASQPEVDGMWVATWHGERGGRWFLGVWDLLRDAKDACARDHGARHL